MNWLKEMFRRRVPEWFRLGRRGKRSQVATTSGHYRTARSAWEALVLWRGMGEDAWLERSDDLGRTWYRVNDDGMRECEAEASTGHRTTGPIPSWAKKEGA